MEDLNKNHSTKAIRNTTVFGGMFVVSQISEYIGNQINNPNIMAVPESGVIALGLVLAGVSTEVVDRLAHRRN